MHAVAAPSVAALPSLSMAIAWDTCAAAGKGCVGWVKSYFGDCVCDARSEASFALGVASLIAWGVAEVPQIVTNFAAKSCHGVSLALLLTWVVGDIFNLVGCILEPATLPTQFYTALMYTATTVVLVLQTIYYDYFLLYSENRELDSKPKPHGEEDSGEKPTDQCKAALTIISGSTSPAVDIFFMSARSLAQSGTPSFGSPYLIASRSGPSHTNPKNDDDDEDEESSSDDEEQQQEEEQPPSTTPPQYRWLPSIGAGIFVSLSASIPRSSASSVRRRILEERIMNTAAQGSPSGMVFGWIMAAIYMGGRLPQIYLNVKRGSVEGLNPLMFIFALIANATYVGSILVRSMEWERIKANLPWLLDAAVCVLLDLFILAQFVYYKSVVGGRRQEQPELDDVRKPLLA